MIRGGCFFFIFPLEIVPFAFRSVGCAGFFIEPDQVALGFLVEELDEFRHGGEVHL